MAENLPKRQIAGDAKWLSTIARLNRRGGHGDISNEIVIGDDWREAVAKILWALSQLQRGCQNPVLGLRAQCWAPEIGETFSGLNPLIPSNETNELLKPNHTYYVRTRRSTAVTLWLPDATDSDGEVIEVKDVDGSADTKNITVKTTKGQTIDGASSLTISLSYGSVQIRSNGQQWYTVARKNASDGSTGNEVTAAAVFAAANRVLVADGNDRSADDSDFTMSQNGSNSVDVASGTTFNIGGNVATSIVLGANSSVSGTLASGHTTVTATEDAAALNAGVDATDGPYEKTYFGDHRTAGTGTAETIIAITKPASNACIALYVEIEAVRSEDAGRNHISTHVVSYYDNGGTLTYESVVTSASGGNTPQTIAFDASGNDMRVRITDDSSVYRVAAKVRVKWRTTSA